MDLRLLEASQWVPWVDANGIRELLQRFRRLLVRVQRHPEVAVERRGARIDGERLAQMMLRKVVLLLPVVNVAQAIPRIVVPLVNADSGAVARHRLPRTR